MLLRLNNLGLEEDNAVSGSKNLNILLLQLLLLFLLLLLR